MCGISHCSLKLGDFLWTWTAAKPRNELERRLLLPSNPEITKAKSMALLAGLFLGKGLLQLNPKCKQAAMQTAGFLTQEYYLSRLMSETPGVTALLHNGYRKRSDGWRGSQYTGGVDGQGYSDVASPRWPERHKHTNALWDLDFLS